MGKLLCERGTQPFVSVVETRKAYVTEGCRKSEFSGPFAVPRRGWTLSRSLWQNRPHAGVVELVDAPDSKAETWPKNIEITQLKQ
jgi:hypothetical protein